ncbi:MAG: pyrroline-5-carboxylate reductase dimerization domain-containing protein, partial [Dongiaceae bacterium]
EVLSALKFRREHHVISLLAITPLEKVAALVAPAAKVVRAIPMPMAANRCCPTVIYPPDPLAAALFNRLGTAVEVANAEQFDAFSTATATMSPYFAFADEIAGWLARHGVPADAARTYVATVFQGLANIAATQTEHSFSALAGEFATRGGINEQVVNHLKDSGALASLSEALDAVLKRMKAAAAD